MKTIDKNGDPIYYCHKCNNPMSFIAGYYREGHWRCNVCDKSYSLEAVDWWEKIEEIDKKLEVEKDPYKKGILQGIKNAFLYDLNETGIGIVVGLNDSKDVD